MLVSKSSTNINMNICLIKSFLRVRNILEESILSNDFINTILSEIIGDDMSLYSASCYDYKIDYEKAEELGVTLYVDSSDIMLGNRLYLLQSINTNYSPDDFIIRELLKLYTDSSIDFNPNR